MGRDGAKVRAAVRIDTTHRVSTPLIEYRHHSSSGRSHIFSIPSIISFASICDRFSSRITDPLLADVTAEPKVAPAVRSRFAPSQIAVLRHMRVLFGEGSHLMVLGYTGVGKSMIVAQLVRECSSQVDASAGEVVICADPCTKRIARKP